MRRHLNSGDTRLVVASGETRGLSESQQRPRYTLDELLAKCDPKAPRRKDEHQWLDAPIAGEEII